LPCITPKSGPLSRMVTLIDADRALVGELPQGYLKRPHWLRAGKALVTAAETGQSSDVECAYEAIVAALDEEAWLSIAGHPLGKSHPTSAGDDRWMKFFPVSGRKRAAAKLRVGVPGVAFRFPPDLLCGPL
jgi:hypothetical protein